DDVFAAVARIAGFLELVAAERDETEQRVVVAVVDPHVVDQRRAHAAAAAAAVAAVAAVREELLLAVGDDVGLGVVVRILDLALRRLLDEIGRRDFRVVGLRAALRS